MKITVITGSQRAESQSLKVGKFIQTQLTETGLTVDLIDLSTFKLPMIASSDMGNPDLIDNLEKLKTILKESDGIVTITPEWDGMATPYIKNFVQVAGKNISHKPNLIVTVSGGKGGAYPVADLRSFGYKNNKTLYIPDHLVIRDVYNVLSAETASEKGDVYIRNRINWSLKILVEYAKALKPMRENNLDLLDYEEYSYGM